MDKKAIEENLGTTVDKLARLTGTTLQRGSAWHCAAAALLNEKGAPKWNEKIALEIYRGLLSIFENQENYREEILSNFLSSFQAYRQIIPSIELVKNNSFEPQTRARLLLVPTYTALAESCFSNLARCILFPLSEATGKQYNQQNKLGQIVNALKANELELLSALPDVDLRNAINHGGINIKGGKNGSCRIDITFTRNNRRQFKTLQLYSLTSQTLDLASGIKGALFGLLAVFERIGAEKWVDEIGDAYEKGLLIGLSAGSPTFRCFDVSTAQMSNQINCVFETSESEENAILKEAERILATIKNHYPEFEFYSISFNHPRLISNFIRATKDEIDIFVANGQVPLTLIKSIASRGDILWQAPSNEEINMADALFYTFPELRQDSLIITDVKDVSLEDRKRIKAKLFVGKNLTRNAIIDRIKEALAWLKDLRNPPCATTRIKHGSMPADCVLVDVYEREGVENRSLAENNTNFICEVEEYSNPLFKYSKNGFTSYLYKNAETFSPNLEIRWRDRKNLTVVNGNKPGRNDPCPCGSRKKYKKCCGSPNRIYNQPTSLSE